MGGVGKTTLAKALFNQLLERRSFKGSCFLANVRENSGTFKGLESLQQQLINDVLRCTTKVEVQNVDQGIKLIEARICSTKVVVVADDLDDLNHFQLLVGPFASGSVVIITTRDEEILDKVNVEPKYRYMLKELDYAQSWELFTKYAFEKAEPPKNLLALSEDILGIAGGLPLALKIFGSYLSTKKEVGWKSYIETLQQYPNSTIELKLLISLDALELDDRMLKKIFIDIACFFVGWNKEKAFKVLETYYSHADEKLDTLKKRCLLTVDEEKLEMHDLLRDMGRNVARNKAPDEPEKYSRLWLPDDVEDVLKNYKGTEAVEGIILNNFYDQYALEGKSFNTETFIRMRKLRFLYFKKVNLTGSFEHMFEDLRVLSWDGCPLKCLPSDFYPEKLVILELPCSNMKTVWDLNMVSRVFGKLKTLNMSCSADLTTTPDFTKLPCLETLDLGNCESLDEVHMSIGSLARLVSINLRSCGKLRSLPDTICNLRALKILTLTFCRSLEALPIISVKPLTEINVTELTVSKLPIENKKLETLSDTICNLRSLEILNIGGCVKLETLPDELWKITRLRELDASGTKMLKNLPDIGSSQIALSWQKLKLVYSGITALPSGFSQLSNLKDLDIAFSHLLSIPKLPPSLKRINAFGCMSMERLPNLSNLKHLKRLNLENCLNLTEIQGLEELTALRQLTLRFRGGLSCNEGLEYLSSTRMPYLTNVNLTKRLFKVYSKFGHEICVYVSEFLDDQKSCPQWPDWIVESPYWTSGEYSESTTVYAHLLPNESHNFMGIILCCQEPQVYINLPFRYSVKNTTSGFIWSSNLCDRLFGSLMVIVPKSIFSVSDEDHRIELTVNKAKIVGIHLLYNADREILEDVVEKNMIDIDALKLVDPMLQDIFLDIACLFLGWKKEEVVPILETYYTNADHNIEILKKKCLLKINDQDELEMDHLLQHLGSKVARNNSFEEPEKHSRLWLSVDIFEVLKKHTGTEAIECIIPRNMWYQVALEGKSLTTEAFKMMSRLRFLYLDEVSLTGSLEKTFESLRWFRWDRCPLKCLPSDFYPQKLVILELPYSNMRTMWELNEVSHVFEKLKNLNLSFSEDLTSTSDFTKLPGLETLNLEGCKSLEEVHISLGSLASLVSLNLAGCIKLKSLPLTICNLKALEILTIDRCTSLESLPTELGNTQSLKRLNASGINVSELPNSIRDLSKLVELNLSGSMYLKTLPQTICNLGALEVLDVLGCSSLEALPMALGNIKSLRELYVEKLTVSKLPDSIGHLSVLVELRLSGNKNLETLPDTICNLRSLKLLDISRCEKLEILPNLSNLKQLEKLFLIDCSGLTVVLGLEELTAIEVLHLTGCNSTLLANIFTECFFQMYSELGHPILIYAASPEFPECVRLPSNPGPTVSVNLPPDVSRGFLGMILCFKHSGDDEYYLNYYSVRNTTSDFVWSGNFDICDNESVMVIIPVSIFSVRDGDERIELTTENADFTGIHPLYITEIVTVEEYDSAAAVDEDGIMEEAFEW